MPVFELETPQGTFEVEAPDMNAALQAIGNPMPDESQPDPNAPPEPQVDPYADRARREADVLRDKLPMLKGGFNAGTSGLSSGMMFGFDDEIGGAFTSPFRAIRDQVGLGEAYKREVALNRAMKSAKQSDHPIASIAGEIGGGLAGGGKLAASGATLIGRNIPKLAPSVAAMAEGAAYGGAYGAGNADGKDMGNEALTGAAIGGVTGGMMHGAGKAFQKAITPKAADPIASSSLHQSENVLFDKARQSGVRVTQQGADKLSKNLTLAAGRLNQEIRPKTAGVLDDALAKAKAGMDVQDVHELRMLVQTELMGAKGTDVKSLSNMLKILDGFIDNPQNGNIVGSKAGLSTLREAIDTSSKRFKTEAIEQLMDLADVQTGTYTQSGMLNALRSKASSLYTQIVKGRAKGFSKEEIAIIRQLAKADTSSAATKLIAKFAPRGPVSMMAGTVAGGFMGGPVGAAIPATMGAVAARGADKGAMAAARNLQRSVSGAPLQKALPNLRNPLLGGGVATTTGLLQQ